MTDVDLLLPLSGLTMSNNRGLTDWLASRRTLIKSFALPAFEFVNNVYAVPLLFERPVRPMRWT